MSPLDDHPTPESSHHPAAKQTRPRRAGRRPYEKPRVIDHGRLSDVALGGSPGVGDSGTIGTQLPPGG